MQYFHEFLRIAMETDSIPAALDALVGIAENLVEGGQHERAASILIFALHYPMRAETRTRAEQLFHTLELGLNHEVISAAEKRAEAITLDELVQEILAQE